MRFQLGFNPKPVVVEPPANIARFPTCVAAKKVRATLMAAVVHVPFATLYTSTVLTTPPAVRT
jgi:hypothetical protein